MGERLPIPTNAGSHVPKVCQGEHDLSHDGLQQEEKWRCEVHGGSQKNVRNIMDKLAYTNPSISRKPVHQARRGKQASPIVRMRLVVVVNPLEAKQSRVDVRAELLRMFENLCDRAGELNICIKCGKESHDGTCKGTARATESDSARGKIQMLLLPEGHPSSDEDIDMEVPDDDEEMAPMSSEPHEIASTGNGRADILSEGGPQVQLRCEPLRDG